MLLVALADEMRDNLADYSPIEAFRTSTAQGLEPGSQLRELTASAICDIDRIDLVTATPETLTSLVSDVEQLLRLWGTAPSEIPADSCQRILDILDRTAALVFGGPRPFSVA